MVDLVPSIAKKRNGALLIVSLETWLKLKLTLTIVAAIIETEIVGAVSVFLGLQFRLAVLAFLMTLIRMMLAVLAFLRPQLRMLRAFFDIFETAIADDACGFANWDRICGCCLQFCHF